MAIPTSAFTTYGVGYPYSSTVSNIGTREDAINTLTMIDPEEAMTLAVLAKTTTNGLRHEWFTDTMQATSTAPALQGEDWGQSSPINNLKALKARTRLTNYVQWFRQDWSITMDELILSQRGQIFGVPNELDYQTGKGGMEVTRNIDARLWANGAAAVSASGDTALTGTLATFRLWGQLSGIRTPINGVSGAAFTTASLYALHEDMWTAGAKPDTLFVSPGVKVDISRVLLGDIAYGTSIGAGNGIAGLAAANVVNGAEYGPVIDFVRTDFGRVAMVVDRWIPQASVTASAVSATATTGCIENCAYMLVEKAKLRVAFWRPVRPYQVASTGDNVKVYVLGACTTEVLHPTAIGLGYNIVT